MTAPHHYYYSAHHVAGFRTITTTAAASSSSLFSSASATPKSSNNNKKKKGKILVLGGTGFLGQQVCQTALREGYDVVSLSRRGMQPPSSSGTAAPPTKIIYRQGDARQQSVITDILNEESSSSSSPAPAADGNQKFVGVVHCVGLLFDDASGLGNLNRFVSGSGSLPDSDSTYETITRITAFNAIEAATQYAVNHNLTNFPFVFTSAAEAGWPDVAGGAFVESTLAPDFLKRYLKAKRAVEAKLLSSPAPPQQQQQQAAAPDTVLRPIICRPSLIYSMDRPASYIPVGAFFVGNKLGLPFVDRPVTVQNLASAMVHAIGDDSVKGVLRYERIDELANSS